MQNITVHRYDHPSNTYGGWIEPEDKSWIIFLDKQGKPQSYWGDREESGAVIGEGVVF